MYLLGVVLVSSKTIMSLFSPLTPLMSIYLLVQLVDNLVYQTPLLQRKCFVRLAGVCVDGQEGGSEYSAHPHLLKYNVNLASNHF